MPTIEAVRTPDERFANLPAFPFEPKYLEGLASFESLRAHYVDEGPADARHVFLCLHGEPTWAYLYRKMIPVFVDAGCRVVAPDFFGFGRSDKPVDDAVYTFDFHRRFLLELIDALQLTRVTLVCQDWGGILGLTLPLEKPDLIERLLVMNTAIATGQSPGEGFLAWRAFVKEKPDLDPGRLLRRAAMLTEPEAAAYSAPFPSREYKAGVRRFPEIVPVSPNMDGAQLGQEAARWWREQWSGPTFMAVGKLDPVLGPPVMEQLRKTIRGCPEPLILEDVGHFVQERGDIVAKAALAAWSE